MPASDSSGSPNDGWKFVWGTGSEGDNDNETCGGWWVHAEGGWGGGWEGGWEHIDNARPAVCSAPAEPQTGFSWAEVFAAVAGTSLALVAFAVMLAITAHFL